MEQALSKAIRVYNAFLRKPLVREKDSSDREKPSARVAVALKGELRLPCFYPIQMLAV
jgi:hypothetical protein